MYSNSTQLKQFRGKDSEGLACVTVWKLGERLHEGLGGGCGSSSKMPQLYLILNCDSISIDLRRTEQQMCDH